MTNQETFDRAARGIIAQGVARRFNLNTEALDA